MACSSVSSPCLFSWTILQCADVAMKAVCTHIFQYPGRFLPECDISSKAYRLCGETMSSSFPEQLCQLIVPPGRRDNADGPNTYTNLSTSAVQGLASITQVKSRLYKVRGQGWQGWRGYYSCSNVVGIGAGHDV